MAKKDAQGYLHDDSNGRFTSKNGTAALEKKYNDDLPLEKKKRIFLLDEILPHSVGAKWTKEEIAMPNGTTAQFVEGSKITHKEVFAGKNTKKPIHDIERLTNEYPGTKKELWQKVKGRAEILWGKEILKAEIHWYEEPSVGKKEIKFKKEL